LVTGHCFDEVARWKIHNIYFLKLDFIKDDAIYVTVQPSR